MRPIVLLKCTKFSTVELLAYVFQIFGLDCLQTIEYVKYCVYVSFLVLYVTCILNHL